MDESQIQKQKTILLVCLDESRDQESIAVMKDLEALGRSFSEVHIARFSRDPFFTIKNIEHPTSHVWIYSISHFPLIRYISFSFFVKRHLLWQGHFRPTHILSYGSDMTSYLASRLAKKYTVPLTIKIGIQDRVLPRLFRLVTSINSMYDTAKHLIVEGGEKVDTLSFYKNKITPVTPFFDFESMLSHPIEPVMFTRKYQKDFFFVSHFENYERSAIEAVCKIMRELKTRYTRGGWIIFVPYADMKQTQSIIRSYGLTGSVFVEPERADMLPIYKGARIFVYTKTHDEFSIPVLFSLTLGIPTLTTPTGYMREVFQGTAFERFVIEQKDTAVFVERIKELVEKDYVFNDYKMNTSSIMKNFPHEPLNEYIEKIVQVVLSDQ